VSAAAWRQDDKPSQPRKEEDTFMTKTPEIVSVTIHADGACSGNPGPGGWAWEILGGDDALICEDAGGELDATNNKMELRACAEALTALLGLAKDGGAPVTSARLRLDSEHVVKGCGEWLPNWKASGWRTAARKPVANDTVWKRIDTLRLSLADKGVRLEFEWVKGHSGDGGNERVDSKAFEMSQSLRAGAAATSASPEISSPENGGGDLFRNGFEAAARAAMRFRPDLAQGFSEAEIIAILSAIHATQSDASQSNTTQSNTTQSNTAQSDTAS